MNNDNNNLGSVNLDALNNSTPNNQPVQSNNDQINQQTQTNQPFNPFIPGYGPNNNSFQKQQPIQQQVFVNQPQTNGFTNTIEDKELLNNYIGANPDKILSGKFNWPAFFFGASYFFYRKMIIPGLVLMILTPIINKLGFLFSVLLWFAQGIIASPLYVSKAKSDIAKIKQNNPTANRQELTRLVISKGGPNILFVFLGFAIEIIIVLALVVILIITGNLGAIGASINYEVKADPTVNVENYVNISNLDDIRSKSVSNGVLTFEAEENAGYSLAIIQKENSLKSFVTKYDLALKSEFKKDYPGPIQLNLNGQTWYKFVVNTSSTIVWATQVKDKVLIVTIDCQSDTPNYCSNFKDAAFKSISIK